jgi:hypothetical protein
MENRRYCDPLVVTDDGATHRLTRVAFDERTVQEGWLQDLLERHPELLPVEDIEPAFAPLIAIGREVGTPVGPIDNLFINPDGYVTLVETKLWRSPEARRQVVGQIIDYVREVSQWDFEDLDRQVRTCARQRSQTDAGLVEVVKSSHFAAELDEDRFADRVTRNLRRGRILLIVAGDGIRESMVAIADYLQQTPQLQFTLALVELLTYKLSPGSAALLVVPQVVARTREITRAVVRVEGTSIESVHVDVDASTLTPREGSRRFTLAEEDFFEILQDKASRDEVDVARRLMSDAGSLGAEIAWRQASFSVQLPDPGASGERLTLFYVSKEGKIGGGWLANKLPDIDLPREIGEQYFEQVAQLFDHCEVKIQPSRDLTWSRGILLSELRESYDQFIEILADTIERIRAAAAAQDTQLA